MDSIIGGQTLEGGYFSSSTQLNALIIMKGGSIDACYVRHTLPVVINAFIALGLVLEGILSNTKGTIKIIPDLATVLRKQG